MISGYEQNKGHVASGDKVYFKADITLSGSNTFDGANQKTTTIDGSDIDLGSISFEDSTSSSSAFDIGSAIIGKMSLTLNNRDGKFNGVNFQDATITPQFSYDGEYYYSKGIYYVDQPDSYAGTIELVCYDNMIKLETVYTDVSQSYPASLSAILQTIASTCDVTINYNGFNDLLSGFIVASREDFQESETCNSILSYVLQIAGLYARCDNNGAIKLGWYDASTTYAIDAWKSMSVNTGMLTYTGVEVKLSDASDEEKNNSASDGDIQTYAYSITNNPLIQSVQPETDQVYCTPSAVATHLFNRIKNLSFVTFSIETISNPFFEAGDVVSFEKVTPGASSSLTYICPVTSVSCTLNGSFKLSCAAASSSKNRSSSIPQASVTSIARRAVASDISRIDTKLNSVKGMYETTKNGVYYFHDNETLESSTVVWKMTTDSIAVSTTGDGEDNYTIGITANGEAILSRLEITGIDASYINAGVISSLNNSATQWDLTNGIFSNSIKDVDSVVEYGFVKTSATNFPLDAKTYPSDQATSTYGCVFQGDAEYERYLFNQRYEQYKFRKYENRNDTDNHYPLVAYCTRRPRKGPNYVLTGDDYYMDIYVYTKEDLTIPANSIFRFGIVEQSDITFGSVIDQDLSHMSISGMLYDFCIENGSVTRPDNKGYVEFATGNKSISIPGGGAYAGFEGVTTYTFDGYFRKQQTGLIAKITYKLLIDSSDEFERYGYGLIIMLDGVYYNVDSKTGEHYPLVADGSIDRGPILNLVCHKKRINASLKMNSQNILGLYQTTRDIYETYDSYDEFAMRPDTGVLPKFTSVSNNESSEGYVGGFSAKNGSLSIVGSNLAVSNTADSKKYVDINCNGFANFLNRRSNDGTVLGGLSIAGGDQEEDLSLSLYTKQLQEDGADDLSAGLTISGNNLSLQTPTGAGLVITEDYLTIYSNNHYHIRINDDGVQIISDKNAAIKALSSIPVTYVNNLE